MDNKIIHIIINDWDTQLETQEAKELLKKLTSVEKDDKSDIPFNYSWSIIEYAQFFFITTTEEDLKKHNLTELMKYIQDEEYLNNPNSMFTINMFWKYVPDKWTSDDNGSNFDIDSLQKALFMFIDDYGDEHMCNVMPRRIDEYVDYIRKYKNPAAKNDNSDKIIESYEQYKKARYNRCAGWFHTIDTDSEQCFELFNYIDLPQGFIEQYLCKKPEPKEIYTYDVHNILQVKLFDD